MQASEASAISWVKPHLLGWVSEDIHGKDLHCPIDGYWHCGGQLIPTSPVRVLCSHYVSAHHQRWLDTDLIQRKDHHSSSSLPFQTSN